ncbi:hypothetical protein [Paenibacillus pinihumi]|uniref:hypothetical protein n=1 Tax=Paenibacillus pinihumi TaxID=669462 RepID=UPI000566A3A3|nr:hypothetical protein [Paenibacillus pinihumi]
MSKDKKRVDAVTTVKEWCLVLGFVMWGCGTWLIWPPIALLTCGGLLMAIGLPKPSKPTKGGD